MSDISQSEVSKERMLTITGTQASCSQFMKSALRILNNMEDSTKCVFTHQSAHYFNNNSKKNKGRSNSSKSNNSSNSNSSNNNKTEDDDDDGDDDDNYSENASIPSYDDYQRDSEVDDDGDEAPHVEFYNGTSRKLPRQHSSSSSSSRSHSFSVTRTMNSIKAHVTNQDLFASISGSVIF